MLLDQFLGNRLSVCELNLSEKCKEHSSLIIYKKNFMTSWVTASQEICCMEFVMTCVHIVDFSYTISSYIIRKLNVTVPQFLHITEALAAFVGLITEWIAIDPSLNFHMLLHLLLFHILLEGTAVNHNHSCAFMQSYLLDINSYFPVVAFRWGWTLIPSNFGTKFISA
jgi:hypothetical protein